MNKSMLYIEALTNLISDSEEKWESVFQEISSLRARDLTEEEVEDITQKCLHGYTGDFSAEEVCDMFCVFDKFNKIDPNERYQKYQKQIEDDANLYNGELSLLEFPSRYEIARQRINIAGNPFNDVRDILGRELKEYEIINILVVMILSWNGSLTVFDLIEHFELKKKRVNKNE